MKTSSRYLFCLLAILLLGNLPATAAAQPMTRHSYLLTQEQISQLRALHIRIMLPAHIPQGFWISSFKAEIVKRPGPGKGPAYNITYTGPGGRSFGIDGTSGGIGDAPADRIQAIRHPQWGLIPILTENIPGRSPIYFCQWLGKGPFYHVYSPVELEPAKKQLSIHQDDFFEVVKSLTYIPL